MNPTAQKIHDFIDENNFSEVFQLLKSQNAHLQEINRLQNTFIQGKDGVDFVQQLRTLTNQIFKNPQKPKSQMIEITELANTVYTAIISTYGVELLKGVGINFAYDKLKNSDSLKKLGEKTTHFFKGKDAEDKLDALEIAVKKEDKEKFEAKSEQIKEILKNTLENEPDFKTEVENMIHGLDDETKNELEKAVQNISTIHGNNNIVIQGNSGNVHIGDKIGRDKIDKQFNIKGDYHESK